MLDILVTIVLASKVIEVISVKECYQLGENELIFEHTQPCIWLQSYEFKSDILVTIVLASKVIEVISVKECYQLGENELIFEHTQPCIWLQSYEFKSVDSRNCS